MNNRDTRDTLPPGQLKETDFTISPALAGIIRGLWQANSWGEAAHTILGGIGKATGAAVVALRRVDGQAGLLRHDSDWHASPAQTEVISATGVFAPNAGMPGITWSSGEMQWLVEPGADPHFQHWAASQAGLHAGAWVPVRDRHAVIGVLEVLWAEPQPLGDALARLLEAVSDQIGAFLSRQRAEEARQAAEANLGLISRTFAKAFHSSPVAIVITELSGGKIIDVNASYQALVGYSREELIHHFGYTLNIYDPSERQSIVQQLRERGSVRNHETRVRTKSGEIRHVLVSMEEIQLDGNACALTTLYDITERKQAEEELRASQQDLNHAQAVAQTGSWRLDVRRNELLWSDETYRMFGITTGTPLTYETFLSAVHPDDRAYVDREWQAAIRGAPYDIEHRIAASSEVRWVRERAELEFDADGVLRGGFGTVQDITERKQAERERERLLVAEAQARREAERQSELRLRFLAMVSHELRTPLTSIKGFATTLLAHDVTWDAVTQRDFLGIIDAEVDKLTEMIDQLLDLSRLEAGMLRIHPETVPFGDALAAVLPQLRAIARDHRLMVDAPADLPAVQLDRQRLAQVLTNLVSNAAKYSARDTLITIAVRRVDGGVEVDIADEGPGIPLQERQRVFEAFRRGSDDRAWRTKGAGLGLAICKGLVEAHGGSIWIQSREGPGAVVSFKLPVAAPS
ncbi:MAG: PAS domain S-box protein [Chloroflexi bacterium]|nr:PAS domain S-box protein [Chloroflexota bacterium]